MRRVNLKFLVVFVIAVLVIAGVVHAVHVMQYDKHASSWKRLADDAEKAGNRRLQVDYLRRYTAMRRTDAEALEKLGTLLLEGNAPWQSQLPLASALNLYETGQGKPEQILAVRRKLVDAALRTGRWSDAEVQLGILIDPDLSGQPNAEQAEYREQLARCHMAVAEWAEAEKELERAIEHDGTRCSSYALLAGLQTIRLEKASAAVRLLKTMVADNPQLADAYEVRTAYRLQFLNNEAVRRAEAAIAGETGSRPEDPADAATSGALPETPPLSTERMLELANADATRALELAPVDRDALLLAMQCANQLSEASAAEQASAQRARARQLAEQIIASCKTEAAERIASAREDDGAKADDAPSDAAPQGAEDERKSNKTESKIAREVYLQAVPAYNVLASVAIREGDTKGAIAVLAEGLENVGVEESLLLNLASLKISQSQAPDEDAEITRLLATLEHQPNARPLADYLRARQSMGRGEWRLAADALEAAKPQLARWPAAQIEAELAIAACRLRLGQPQVAEAMYRQLVDANPSLIAARWGLAVTLEAQNKNSEAYAQYQFIVNQRKVLPVDSMYGDLVLRTVRAMIEKYAGQDADSPVWKPAEEFIDKSRTAVLESGGDPARLATLDVMQADLLVAQKRLDAADELLSAALERDPEAAICWMALVALRDIRQEWQLAEQTLEEAQEKISADDEVRRIQLTLTAVLHHLRRLTAALNDNDSAAENITPEHTKALVSELIATAPMLTTNDRQRRDDYHRAKASLAQVSLSLGDAETASRLYREIAAADVNQLQVRFALLGMALRSGQIDDVQSILEEIKEIDGEQGPMWNFGEATRLSLSRREGDQLRSDLVRAETHLRVPERAWPGSIRVRMLRSHIVRRQGRIAEAVESDLEAFRAGYATPEFISQLVKDLYSLKRFEEAADVLSRIKDNASSGLAELAPTAMAVSGIVRDEAQSRQLRTLAVSLARAAADDTQDYRVKLAYGMMLLQADDRDAARHEFETARDLAPESPEPWLLLVELDVRTGETERARQTLDQAAHSIREADRDYALARGYLLLNEPELSRQHWEQALASVPQDLAQATAGQIEILEGAADAYLVRAQLELSEARKIADESPDAAGDRQRAAGAFEATGIQLLERLIKDGGRALSDLSASTDVVGDRLLTKQQLSTSLPRARRRLALLVFGKRGAGNRERAQQLVEANRTRDGFLPEDARLYAIVLSQSPMRNDKRKALQELENLIQGATNSPDQDLMLAATLHLAEYQHFKRLSTSQQSLNKPAAASHDATAQQHLAAARDLMNKVVVAATANLDANGRKADVSPNYVQALVALIDILLINNEVHEAEFYLRQLNSAAPGTQAAVNAAANIRFADGQHAAAIEVIERFAADGDDEQHEARLLASVQMLEGLAGRAQNDDDASAYFEAAERQIATVVPEERRQLLMAAFLARRGDKERSMDLIDEVARTASDTQLASAGVYALRSVGHDAALLQRLLEALRANLETHPGSIPIKLMIADVYSWMGDVGRSADYYREVLAASPNHAAAANNLAFLLASQRRDFDQAVNLIDGVIARQGPMPELLDTRAYVLLKRGGSGDAQAAVTELGRALENDYQQGYLFHQAQAYLALNETLKAAGVWSQAVAAGLAENTVHPLELRDFQYLSSQFSSQQ